MASVECSICKLDAKPRKLIESLLKVGLSARDAAEFAEWYGIQHGTPIKIAKSSVSRHENNGHFQSEAPANIELDGEVLTLRQYAKKIFETYQKANEGKVPSTKETIDFLLADAKLADLESRRNDEQGLAKLVQGTSYRRPTEGEKVEANSEPE